MAALLQTTAMAEAAEAAAVAAATIICHSVPRMAAAMEGAAEITQAPGMAAMVKERRLVNSMRKMEPSMQAAVAAARMRAAARETLATIPQAPAAAMRLPTVAAAAAVQTEEMVREETAEAVL